MEYHRQYDGAVNGAFHESENKRPPSRMSISNIIVEVVPLGADNCYIPAGLATRSEQVRICPRALVMRSEQPGGLSTHRRRGWLTEVYSHLAIFLFFLFFGPRTK